MGTRTVLVFIVLVLLQAGFSDGRPVPSTGDVSQTQPTADVSQHNCTCEETIVCGGAKSWVPWLSCVVSCLLFLVPGIRLYKTEGQQGIQHCFFFWSIVLSFFSYNAWFWYSNECRPGESTFPILVTSIVGVLINGILIGWASNLNANQANLNVNQANLNVNQANLNANQANLNANQILKIYIVGGLTVILWLLCSIIPVSVDGWLGLALGVLSHLFRMKATSYDNFNEILAVTTLAGCANGFIWLKHPNLCIAGQYKIASYVIGVLRGSEAFLWFSPWIGQALWRVEVVGGGQRDAREE